MKRRWLTRMSVVMLVATLTYWCVAAAIGPDFRNLSGKEDVPAASFVLGRTEYAWLVEARGVMVCVVNDPGGENLPLIRRYGFFGALFSRVMGTGGFRQGYHLPFTFVGVFEGAGQNASPVSMRLAHVSFGWFLVIFAIAPARPLVSRVVRYTRHRWRALRVGRLRTRRQKLGLCNCGYDLRMTRGRCPECGRVVRWIPVSLEPGKRNIKGATI
jgi:hypothetical protein